MGVPEARAHNYQEVLHDLKEVFEHERKIDKKTGEKRFCIKAFAMHGWNMNFR